MANDLRVLMSTLAAALILLLCVVGASSSDPPPRATVASPGPDEWWYPSGDTMFDAGTFRYTEFIWRLLHAASSFSRGRLEDHIMIMPVLQPGWEPGTWERPQAWNMITLLNLTSRRVSDVDTTHDDVAHLTIRIDSFSLAGFANRSGTWHAYSDQHHLITNSVPLDFTADYRDLVGGYDQLHTLRLGRDATLEALRVVANYVLGQAGRDAAAAVDELKRALAVLAITICEAARFPRIRDKIQAGWVDGTYLDETDEGYIANWRTFSCAVRICDKYRRWPPEEGGALYELFGIWNCDQAREEIDMLLQANNCSKPVECF
ncbi:hypothetical protein ACP70R_029983 [Stipagrostis hirtigluma subsp. patula]